jgi:hypothetical protein
MLPFVTAVEGALIVGALISFLSGYLKSESLGRYLPLSTMLGGIIGLLPGVVLMESLGWSSLAVIAASAVVTPLALALLVGLSYGLTEGGLRFFGFVANLGERASGRKS